MGWPESFDGRPADLGHYNLSVTSEHTTGNPDGEPGEGHFAVTFHDRDRRTEIGYVACLESGFIVTTIWPDSECSFGVTRKGGIFIDRPGRTVSIPLNKAQCRDLHEETTAIYVDTEGADISSVNVVTNENGQVEIRTKLADGRVIRQPLPRGVSLDRLDMATTVACIEGSMTDA